MALGNKTTGQQEQRPERPGDRRHLRRQPRQADLQLVGRDARGQPGPVHRQQRLGAFDNLLAIGSGIAPMTFETSAALGTDPAAVLDAGSTQHQARVGPSSDPAVQADQGRRGVRRRRRPLHREKSTPATLDAAWQLIKSSSTRPAGHLVGRDGVRPDAQVGAAQPPRSSAWTKVPGYKVAYKQILASPSEPGHGR